MTHKSRITQPMVVDSRGVLRFKANKLIVTLLKESSARGFNLNHLSMTDASQEDWEQSHQLIGYSLCGYRELSEVSDETAMEATKVAQAVVPGTKGCRDTGCEIHIGVPREEAS